MIARLKDHKNPSLSPGQDNVMNKDVTTIESLTRSNLFPSRRTGRESLLRCDKLKKEIINTRSFFEKNDRHFYSYRSNLKNRALKLFFIQHFYLFNKDQQTLS